MGIRNLGQPLLAAVTGAVVFALPLQAASLGLGAGISSYHNKNTGSVLPISFAPRIERYEFGLTLFGRQYVDPLGGGNSPLKVDLAPKQYVLTFSRRWVLRREHRLQPYLGFGFAWFSGHPCDGEPDLPAPAPKGSTPETCNYLLGTRLNFTEQFGLRVPLDANRDWHIEASWRHFSNGGLDKLNRGQNALQVVLRRHLP
jgi:hypothetical protein